MRNQIRSNSVLLPSQKTLLLVFALLGTLLISCTSSSSQQNIRSQSSQEEGTAVEAENSKEKASNGIQDPIVTIEWFSYSTEDEFLRFLAKVSNPNSVGLSGTKLSWEALDKNGAYVGGISRRFDFIPGNSEWFYVGGAGSAWLSGPVSTVEVFLDSPGKADDTTELALFDVEEIVIDTGGGRWYWRASARVKSPDKTISSSDIIQNSIVYDREGNIVCADFDTFLSSAFPETVRPGTVVMLDLLFNADMCDFEDAYRIDLFVFEK